MKPSCERTANIALQPAQCTVAGFLEIFAYVTVIVTVVGGCRVAELTCVEMISGLARLIRAGALASVGPVASRQLARVARLKIAMSGTERIRVSMSGF